MEKRILVVGDGSEGVKAAIETLNAIERTRAREGEPLPIVLENRKIRASPFIPMMIGMLGTTASRYGGDPTGDFWPEPPKPTKKCLLESCSKEHKHNNSFCSPECCKAYKLK